MNTTQSNDEMDWPHRAKEILHLLKINDSKIITTEHIPFWERVSLTLTIPPQQDINETVKNCIEKIGGHWDETQFLDESGTMDNESTYTEFNSLLQKFDQTELDDLISGESVQREFDFEDEETITEKLFYETSDQKVGQIVDSLISGEITLDPRWQRQFVWDLKKSQKFLESLFLNVPTPSILLVNRSLKDDPIGLFDETTVVDGRQRLETLLRFVATNRQISDLHFTNRRFKTPNQDNPEFKHFHKGEPLAQYANSYFSDLPINVQRTFKARLIPVTIISQLNTGDKRILYHIFDRYNTGSAKLNPAEIRNAVYQETPIHETIWTLSREGSTTDDPAESNDPIEVQIITELKDMMPSRKRYGTYDFIGRVLAFTHLNVNGNSDGQPSPNIATNRFFDYCTQNFKDREDPAYNDMKKDFFQSYKTVEDWYGESAFVKPPNTDVTSGVAIFHRLAATIQLATTSHILKKIENNELDLEKVTDFISSNWMEFAGINPQTRRSYTEFETANDGINVGLFQLRQNAHNSWTQQKSWEDKIIAASKIS